MEVQVSFLLALAAGAVSFLSACVLPVVPGHLACVTALTLDELAEADARRARRGALAHSVIFMVGFGIVFMSLGLVASRVGPPIARALPWIQQAGGGLIALYGVYLTGALGLLGLDEAIAGPLRTRTARALGSLAAGVGFGAGWTPCIGPVLGSILLYASREETMVHGGLLLGTYGVGLSLPFVAMAVALNWPLAGSTSVEAWIVPLRRLAGGVLVVLGLAMVTGHFARLTAFLAGLGQLINLEIS